MPGLVQAVIRGRQYEPNDPASNSALYTATMANNQNSQSGSTPTPLSPTNTTTISFSVVYTPGTSTGGTLQLTVNGNTLPPAGPETGRYVTRADIPYICVSQGAS